MANATLVLGQKITLMESVGACVIISSDKMGNFTATVSRFDRIDFNGMAKPAKMAKYQSLLVEAGFSVKSEQWVSNAGFEGKNSDVISFNITYAKA